MNGVNKYFADMQIDLDKTRNFSYKELDQLRRDACYLDVISKQGQNYFGKRDICDKGDERL